MRDRAMGRRRRRRSCNRVEREIILLLGSKPGSRRARGLVCSGEVLNLLPWLGDGDQPTPEMSVTWNTLSVPEANRHQPGDRED